MKRNILIILACIIFIFYSCENDESTEANKKTIQLIKGKIAGTFYFFYVGNVTWVLEPHFPVLVCIESMEAKKICAQKRVEGEKQFTITADLKPGSYRIISKVLDKKAQQVYEDFENWMMIQISDSGVASYTDFTIEHKLRLKVRSPHPLDIYDLRKGNPTLHWEPLKDASYYSIYWNLHLIKNSGHSVLKRTPTITLKENTFVINIDVLLQKNEEYTIFWLLRAFTETNKCIAEKDGSFVVSQ